MSKEKAIDNIKEALKYTAKTAQIGTSPADKMICWNAIEYIMRIA